MFWTKVTWILFNKFGFTQTDIMAPNNGFISYVNPAPQYHMLLKQSAGLTLVFGITMRTKLNCCYSSVIYGRLGVEIAEAVVSSIMPYNSLWTSDLRILSPFHVIVNESMMDAHKSTKCLAEYILNLNLDVPSLTANETALKTLLHLSAVKIANEVSCNFL